jgi:hypothetical protein
LPAYVVLLIKRVSPSQSVFKACKTPPTQMPLEPTVKLIKKRVAALVDKLLR